MSGAVTTSLYLQTGAGCRVGAGVGYAYSAHCTLAACWSQRHPECISALWCCRFPNAETPRPFRAQRPCRERTTQSRCAVCVLDQPWTSLVRHAFSQAWQLRADLNAAARSTRSWRAARVVHVTLNTCRRRRLGRGVCQRCGPSPPALVAGNAHGRRLAARGTPPVERQRHLHRGRPPRCSAAATAASRRRSARRALVVCAAVGRTSCCA